MILQIKLLNLKINVWSKVVKMSDKNNYSEATNIRQKKALQYKSNFIQRATVKNVDCDNGTMKVRLSSKKVIDIPFQQTAQPTGTIDICVPSPGDIVLVYQDSVIEPGIQIGFDYLYFPGLFQDQLVMENMQPTETLLLPPLKPGNRFIRSSQGSSLCLNGDIDLTNAIGNKLILDSKNDKFNVMVSQVNLNLYLSEVKAGVVKRYNPDLPFGTDGATLPYYDTVILDPDNPDIETPMTEFTVYLGKSLVKTLDSPNNYLGGSDTDPNFKEFDFDIGKENDPSITFSLTDIAVTSINGDFFPELNTSKLKLLLDISKDFSIEVNTIGSLLLGRANAAEFNGLILDNTIVNPFIQIGTNRSNNFKLHKIGSIEMMNEFGIHRILLDGTISLANQKFQMLAIPTDEKEEFQLFINTTPPFLMRATNTEFVLSAGNVVETYKDGELQIAAKKIHLGQPNKSTKNTYEPALLGQETLSALVDITDIILDMLNEMMNPLIGLANYVPTFIPTMLQKIAELQGIQSTLLNKNVSPLLSKQVNIGG